MFACSFERAAKGSSLGFEMIHSQEGQQGGFQGRCHLFCNCHLLRLDFPLSLMFPISLSLHLPSLFVCLVQPLRIMALSGITCLCSCVLSYESHVL
jgi:hypothetical protein